MAGFITPLERRCFIDEEHLDIGEHTDYVAAMKQTAENLNVPLIDLYSMSRAEMRKAGAEKPKNGICICRQVSIRPIWTG